MERFTNNYIRFLESVKAITSDLFTEKNPENNPSLPEKDNDKLIFFVRNWYPHMKEVSCGNLEYFESKGVSPFVFQNLKFLDLTSKVNEKNKNVIWEYLHSLYALSISNKLTKDIFSNYEEKETDSQDEKEVIRNINIAIDNFPEYVANMVTWRREKKEVETKQETKQNNQTPLDEKFLENSKLAKLAKEISDEINPNEILDLEGDIKDMDNPMNLFQSLLSGDKDKGVGKLMTTVCDKLKNKMESGEVNQEDLLSEATTLLQTMGGLGGGGKGGTPDLSSMMSMMQNLSAMGDLFNGPSGVGGGSRHSSRKVRRKMEKKIKKNRNKKSSLHS